ncbi:hypothetical protein [Streptomyces sp. NPDC046859]|uniref:hypothetical protein n=1 Tax=Streptomyces sp. NPDC046859 TaxID=3155734 RepID=UPI00340AD3CB
MPSSRQTSEDVETMRKAIPAALQPTALSRDATAATLAAHRRRAWAWLWGGCAAMVAGLAVGPSADEAGISWLNEVAVFCVGGGPVVMTVGVATLVNCRRMRRALMTRPWAACTAVAIPLGQGAPRVVLRDPVSGGLLPLTVRTVQQRYHLAAPGPGGVLWWCGDPRAGGVLAQPGGEQLLWARPTRAERARRSDVQAAEHKGLLSRAHPPQPQAVVSDEPIQHREPDLSYAAMAAAASRLVFPDESPGRPHRDPDVRTVPWWRIRALLEISQLWPTAVNALRALALVLAWLLVRQAGLPILLVAAVLCGINALRFGYGMIVGIPAVKALARATRAPVPVPKRYVLLPGPDDGLVLVLFPAHGGPTDLPEAAMEVNPPGTPRHPWSGMPPLVGTAELHGWLDDGPTVVPWIDGRPLWPRQPYESVNPNDQRDRDYFVALVGDTVPEA